MYRIFFIMISIILTLSAETKTALLTGIARDAIVSHLTDHNNVDKNALTQKYPYLAYNGATFITLNEDEALRGCIGSLKAYRPLIDDIVSNAQSAAFSDPRFMALNRQELSGLEVEVSILTTPKRVHYRDIISLKEQIIVGESGVELEYGRHRSTFLPQVWEQLPDFETFFSYLCDKAELPQDCLKLQPDIYSYRVEKFSEKSLITRPVPNAGSFYPKDCSETKKWFTKFDAKMKVQQVKLPEVEPRAFIVPHAGYMYSGYTASLAYTLSKRSHAKRVVIVGPSHSVSFNGISVANYEAFQTPCGILRNDEVFVKSLMMKNSYGFAKAAHEKEHSTEVQLPFINYYIPQMKVVELIYGENSKTTLVSLMVRLLKDPDTLLIVSSDLSHFYNQKDAQKRDFICLDAVERRDASLLRSGCEACGFTGVEALLEAVKQVGLRSTVLDYRSSAVASGDRDRVVGYMSSVFY